MDIDVGPMRCSLPFLKDLLLQCQILVRSLRHRRVACIDNSADSVCLGVHRIVHLPRIPQDQVTGLGADFDKLASMVFIPLYMRFLERIEVVMECGQWAFGSVRWVLLEEFVEELGAAFHHYKAS